MVTAKEVMAHFNMPRGTLYWLVRDGRIPVHPSTNKPYRRKRELRFLISEIEAILGKAGRP